MSNSFDRAYEERASLSTSNSPPEPESLAGCIFDNVSGIVVWGLACSGLGALVGCLFDNAETGIYVGGSVGAFLRSVYAYYDIKYFILDDKPKVVREFRTPSSIETGDNPLGDELVERFEEHLDNVGSDYE